MRTIRWLALSAAATLSGCGDSSAPSQPTSTPPADQPIRFRAPATFERASTSATIDGVSGAILPSGRFVTPAGTEVSVLAPKPHALCLSRDGTTAISVNLMGTNPQGAFPFSATRITGLDTGAPSALPMPVDATYNGCVFSAEGARFYVAGGDNGNVWVGDPGTGQYIGSVNLNGPGHPLQSPLVPIDPTFFVRGFKGAFPGRMALSADGNFLYVVDQGAFKLHVIDTRKVATGTPGLILDPDNFDAVVASVDTGFYPYAVTVSADGGHALVANVGMFRYTHLRPETPTGDADRDYPVCFPAAGYPDEVGAPVALQIDPLDSHALPDALNAPGTHIQCAYASESRMVTVPAVGDPNAIESSSVWAYSLADPAHPALDARTPTGARIGDVEDGIATYGASHPNAIAAGAKAIYVALGNHDAIAVLDPATFAERARIPLVAASGPESILKGLLPSDVALSPDGATLYVAEAGINAVGVVALGAQGGLDGDAMLLGHIPTGWWPSALAISSDGQTLYVTSASGRGDGPSSLQFALPPLDYAPVAAIGPKNFTIGTFNIVPVPDPLALAADTAQVLRNNGLVDVAAPAAGVVPARFGERSTQIRHVVLINKENASYDFLLGHITQTRAGEPVEGLPANSVGQRVVPNHTELALQFAFSDNFYLEPVVSSDGHRWLHGFYATEYEETKWPTNYGQKRADSGDDAEVIETFPGRVSFSSAMPEPIDYNKHGGTFVHLLRNGRTVQSFGNFGDYSNADEGAGREPTGAAQHVNVPMMKALRDHTDPLYAGFNLNIPDSPLPSDSARYNRFGRFRQVFEKQFVVDGECRLPDYTMMMFPQDHVGPPDAIEPDSPWSFQRFLQDNDAAVGLTLELISHSPCWQDTVVFVLEDDTQNGVDHVDGHRSLLLAISPWVKRQYVSHQHASLTGVLKTIYLLLGVPPLNQFDAVATDLRDLFTTAPDFTPYDYLPPQFLSAKSRETRAWIDASADVDFREMDGDEEHLEAAIARAVAALRQP